MFDLLLSSHDTRWLESTTIEGVPTTEQCHYCTFWHYFCRWIFSLFLGNVGSGAYEQDHATPVYFCHGVFINRFIFRSNLLWMRFPWECHNQSQDTYWRDCVTGPELPFFHKRKGVLKIDQSVKMPWLRLSMGVASSCSSAPGWVHYCINAT